jgi:hypothetical protein
MSDLPDNLPEPLETDLVTTRFDAKNRILLVHYREELTAESTLLMYEWAFKTALVVGIEFLRGIIYDFTEVKKFTRSNLIATQKGSLTINAQIDLSRIPVAMVAKSLLQEQHLSIGLNATPGEERKRIVRTIQEGTTFIDQWHIRRAKELEETNELPRTAVQEDQDQIATTELPSANPSLKSTTHDDDETTLES